MITEKEKERDKRYVEVIVMYKKKIYDLERKIYLYPYAVYSAAILGMVLGMMMHEIGVKIWS